MPLIVGLTGGIASGKSTVSRWIRDRGIPVWDADAKVASILEDAWHPLCLEFSDMDRALVNDEGVPVRSALRRYVMQDPQANARCKAMFASYLHWDRLQWLKSHSTQAVVVLDVPLLFESNTPHDVALVVDVSVSTQKERLQLRNPNLSNDEIEGWLRMQMTREDRCARARWILDNNGDVAFLQHQLQRWLREIEFIQDPRYNSLGLDQGIAP